MKTTIKLTKTGVITLITFTLVSTSLQAVEARSQPTISAKKTIKLYQLKTCIVSNEELGSMGDYIRFVYQNQEIKVCCKPCIKKFKKNPKKYLKLLDKATKKKTK